MSFLDITLELLEGFGISCMLFALTLLFAIPLGLLFSFGANIEPPPSISSENGKNKYVYGLGKMER